MSQTSRHTKSISLAARIGLLAVAVVLGVAFLLRNVAQKRTTFDDDSSNASSINLGAVPRDVRVSAEQTMQTFIDDLRHKNYDHALTATTSNFPDAHSVAALKLLADKKSFAPIFASPLNFESASLGSHGQKMIVRASTQMEGTPYRTVCSLTNKNGTWLISSLLDPAPPGKRGVVQAGKSIKSN